MGGREGGRVRGYVGGSGGGGRRGGKGSRRGRRGGGRDAEGGLVAALTAVASGEWVVYRPPPPSPPPPPTIHRDVLIHGRPRDSRCGDRRLRPTHGARAFSSSQTVCRPRRVWRDGRPGAVGVNGRHEHMCGLDMRTGCVNATWPAIAAAAGLGLANGSRLSPTTPLLVQAGSQG